MTARVRTSILIIYNIVKPIRFLEEQLNINELYNSEYIICPADMFNGGYSNGFFFLIKHTPR